MVPLAEAAGISRHCVGRLRSPDLLKGIVAQNRIALSI
jgi:hypothetical protein